MDEAAGAAADEAEADEVAADEAAVRRLRRVGRTPDGADSDGADARGTRAEDADSFNAECAEESPSMRSGVDESGVELVAKVESSGASTTERSPHLQRKSERHTKPGR